MGPSWSSKESDLELESDSGEESEDMDDLEDGEIKQDMGSDGRMQDAPQNPTTEVEPSVPVPVGNDTVLEDRESPKVHRSIDINVGEKLDGVHGEENMAARELRDKGDLVGNLDEINCSGKDGPNENNLGGNKIGLGYGSPSVGPTPMVNLGKRNRDDQSTPSIGSVQGPTQKLFYQLNSSVSSPLDLNTPVTKNLVTGEAEAEVLDSRVAANVDEGSGLPDREVNPRQGIRQEAAVYC
ncbi:hypothetical protein Hanom_Chr12g01077171 [Helianthus anomalus]